MSSHKILLDIVKTSKEDFVPWGEIDHVKEYKPDCSCNCKFFLKVDGELGSDWGVCTNRHSHRAGLLTFKHMGCSSYSEKDSYMD
jgi:hypothetical protein